MIALDSSALLAMMFDEPGHATVRRHLAECVLSTVNLAEVLSRLVRDNVDAADALVDVRTFPIEIIPFSPEHAALAASLAIIGRPLGLSLGDRACLALALERRIPVLTADRRWRDAGLDIEIMAVR